MIDLHQMRIFKLVAEKKSFSEAAEAMYLTQPTVSSHIKHLEESLGVVLFDRLPRSVELTKAGEILYGYSKDIIKLHGHAIEAIQEFSGRITGTIHIGGSTIPGEYILPGLLRRFREKAPEVEVHLGIADSKEISSQVLEGKIEIGVVGAQPKEESIESFPFCIDSLTLIVHPSHPLALKKKTSVPWNILLTEPLWLRERGSGTQKTFAGALAAKGKEIKDLNGVGYLGSTEAVKNAVKDGAGAAVVSSLAIREDIECGRLYSLGISGLDLKRYFHVIRHRHRTLSPAASCFHDFLLQTGRDLNEHG